MFYINFLCFRFYVFSIELGKLIKFGFCFLGIYRLVIDFDDRDIEGVIGIERSRGIGKGIGEDIFKEGIFVMGFEG